MSVACGMGAVILWLDGAAVVTSVNPLGPAGLSGEVLVGDQIAEVGGTAVTSVEQARALIVGPRGSKVVLKLRRNITSLGFDTFHVLIERKPSTAPSSPQTPTHRLSAAPCTAPSSSASATSQDPKRTVAASPISSSCDAAAYSAALNAHAAAAPTAALPPLQQPAESLSTPAVAMTSASDCEAAMVSSSASHPAANNEARSVLLESAHAASAASPRTTHSAAPRGRHAHWRDTSHGGVSQHVSCHRKLQLDADASEHCAGADHDTPPCPIGGAATASDPKPRVSLPPPALPPAPQLYAVEAAITRAAAAQKLQAVMSCVAVQEQHVAVTDAAPCDVHREAAEARRQEQRLWAMVNSTILSDLMKSLGPKSIFHP